MRPATAALLSLVALACAGWHLTSATRQVGGSESLGATGAPEAESSAAALDEPEDAPPLAPAHRVDADLGAPDAAPLVGASNAAACVVVGRAIDVDRRPVAGAEVRLTAHQVWAEGRDVPRVDAHVDLRGFVTRTDASGAFRFAVPPPTNPRQQLALSPGPFLDSYSTVFGQDSHERRPPLAAGVTDVGEVMLGATGTVSGRVLAENGTPIVDALVDLGPDVGLTYSRDARTRADGTYLVPHAPVGTYGVSVEAAGYVSAFVAPVTVDARRETAGIDVVLSVAETLQGTVRDEAGQPLAGARLWGWPVGSGRGAGGTSGADGRFTVTLPQDEPYTLEATLAGYARWGDENDRTRHFAPGTRDIEVVLQVQERLHVAVVDLATGAPLTRFGISVLEDNASSATRRVYTEKRRPWDKDYTDGVATVSARAGEDLLVVAAEGYVLTAVDAAASETSPPTQVIRLRRAPTVRGRAWRAGAPLADAAVELVGGKWDTTRERQSVPSDPAAIQAYVAAEAARPRWFRPDQNGARVSRTDDQGRFELAPERLGGLRLSIEAGAGWSLVRAPLGTTGDADLDLGDLHADVSGQIEGTLLVPPGVAPSGAKVFLDDWSEHVYALADDTGRFQFDDIAPGNHLLTLDDRPGTLAAGLELVCEVRAAESTPVTLDARDRGMCELALTVFAPGLELAGLQVDVRRAGNADVTQVVGQLDERGVVRGSVRALGAAHAFIWGLGVTLADQPLELHPLDKLERTLTVGFGRLELRWPPGFVPPEEARVQCELVGIEPGAATQSMRFDVGTEPAGARFRADASGATFEHALVGRSRLTISVTDPQETTVTVLPGGGTSSESRVLLRTVVDVTVEAGATTVVQL